MAGDAFYFDKIGMVIFFGGCIACCLYGAARNYFAQKSFSSNTVMALAVFMPLYALLFYLVKINSPASMIVGMVKAGSFIYFARLLPALVLVLAALLLIGTMSAAFATRLSFLANLILCLAVFLGGLVAGPWIQTTFGPDSFTGTVLGALIPNWQQFWMSNALQSGAFIPGSYLLKIAAYVLLYGLICTVWAAALFENTELAKDSRI